MNRPIPVSRIKLVVSRIKLVAVSLIVAIDMVFFLMAYALILAIQN